MKWILAVGLAMVLAGCAHTSREAGVQVRKESLATAAPGEIYLVKVYVIKKGDTLSSIARRFHKTVAELSAMNPEVKPNRLPIGQRITVGEMKSR
jgi:LysM repeat protein